MPATVGGRYKGGAEDAGLEPGATKEKKKAGLEIGGPSKGGTSFVFA